MPSDVAAFRREHVEAFIADLVDRCALEVVLAFET
jgi:hypothetical protein